MPLRLFLVGLLLLAALGLGLIGYQATRPATVVTVAAPVPPPPPLTVDVPGRCPWPACWHLDEGRGLHATCSSVGRRSAERPNKSSRDPNWAAWRLAASLPRTREHPHGGRRVAPKRSRLPRRGVGAGTRAISIGVDAITGNGGLIWPGDRVDVILTQELTDKDASVARRIVGETVLSDVRVVAVDQSIAQGAVATGDNATGRVAHTVTLEVTQQQAERTAVADRLGKVTLAIRAADGGINATGHRGLVYGGDVSAALTDGGAAAPLRMRLIEGEDARDVTFP